VEHYQQNELPNKTPYTQEVYEGYLNTHLLPRWQDHFLSSIKPVAFEAWLKELKLAEGTKAKLRNLMHAVYTHGMRWEFVNANPISLVRQSAKRERIPDVLTADEVNSLLKELPDPWRTAVYVAVTTGLRVSELLGLKWSDIDFAAGEIRLSRGVVRQHVGEMKTEASRKPVPLDSQLAEVLITWRSVCPYNRDSDYIFASPDKQGTQPYWPTAGMEKHVRPAAARAEIAKQIGWHTLRHTFGTLIKAGGADVATTQALMRHASASITMDRYVQAISEAKRHAQNKLVQQIRCPNAPRLLTDTAVSG
jgi:integrase